MATRWMPLVALLAATHGVSLAAVPRSAAAGGPAPPALQAPEVPAAREEWERRLADARSRRRSGRLLAVAGAVVLAAGEAPYLSTTDRASMSTGTRVLALTGILGGFGLGAWGAVRWKSAGGDIEVLEREGRSKGYLAGAPLPRGGVGVRVVWQF